MNKIWYLLCFSLIVFNSCKGTKAVNESRIKKLNAEKVIVNHYNRSFNFKTLNARIKVKYHSDKQSFSPYASLRIEKDKAIWLSVKMLGITLAKALITPEKVSYYEKIENTYFEGDFKLLSKWLGTDLDYDKLQQLLLGQSLFNLREDKYEVTIEDRVYQLQPKKELELFERLFLLRPDTFKMVSQQLNQPIENRRLNINYASYQIVGNQDFPKQIYIEALQGKEKTTIEIDYKTVDYNTKIGFPFTIPSGYKQVTVQ
ncbi:DUF4292 domain-containing protein [Aquimarina muelleri]|uniref:Deoxyuridine 5'-triphosphate nucleotidohydrolase n=1 Tax=Aquimarina muelleri TaxID=279356 RepID=A0A918JY09_9FLAO|nr:DUF4292 domain-containing protein [Aquimarina muelleri]MCX2764325.1 DUF4292 domain-containing protein [Aquimarina muelleri]GGX31934.1 hypothetical protein GCM10007384_36060 [Aquimarina muelleri]